MNKKFLHLFFFTAILSVTLGSYAQQAPAAATVPRAQPSPEEMKKLMEMSMGGMIPVMAKMTDAMLEVTLQKGEDPATARRIAKFKKNLYDALVSEGFSKEQAFSIMQSTPLPSAAPMTK